MFVVLQRKDCILCNQITNKNLCYIFNNLVATSANILISSEESTTSNKNADWIPNMRAKNIVLRECGLFYNEITRQLGSLVTTSEFVKFFL